MRNERGVRIFHAIGTYEWRGKKSTKVAIEVARRLIGSKRFSTRSSVNRHVTKLLITKHNKHTVWPISLAPALEFSTHFPPWFDCRLIAGPCPRYAKNRDIIGWLPVKAIPNTRQLYHRFTLYDTHVHDIMLVQFRAKVSRFSFKQIDRKTGTTKTFEAWNFDWRKMEKLYDVYEEYGRLLLVQENHLNR